MMFDFLLLFVTLNIIIKKKLIYLYFKIVNRTSLNSFGSKFPFPSMSNLKKNAINKNSNTKTNV